MLQRLQIWVASGAVLAGALGAPSATFAQQRCEPRPVLARIALYQELGTGQHQAIGHRQIALMIHGFAPDHFDFEVKGFDQFGRLLQNFTFTPVLVFPGGGIYGNLEVLGDHHLRFHAGAIPVPDLHVYVQDRHNPNIRTALHLGITPPVPEQDVVVIHGNPAPCRVVRRVVENPGYGTPYPTGLETHPIGYALPTPHVANPVYPVRRWRHHERSGISIRFGTSDGNSGFGFFFRDED